MKQTVEQIMAKTLKVPESDIHDHLTMDDLEDWDSLKHMELIIAIETSAGIELTFDEIVNMRSVLAIKKVLYARGMIEL